MKFTVLARSTALASSLLLFAGTAMAQQTTDTTAAPGAGTSQGTMSEEDRTSADGEPANDGVIVVTGSRIARPNDVSAAPVTTITAAELTQTARTSIGDVLNDLPQLQSTFSQSNSTRFSAPPASTCSTFAVSARSARWYWSTVAATSVRTF